MMIGKDKRKSTMRFRITGIEAQSKKQCDTFKTLRPVGSVRLIRDKENAYDPFAIEVWFDDVMLGYVPGMKRDGVYTGSDLQKRIIEDQIYTAKITGYGYIDGNDWNDDHRGRLGSVELEIGVEESAGRSIGGDYMRVTEFISYLNPYGKSDGLIKWAFDQGNTYEAYSEALNSASEAGTALHLAIETELLGKPPDGEFGRFSAAWENFKLKYEIEPIWMEERFYDSTLMVTGQPDFFGYCNGKLMVLDWKSSKKPSIKHLMQLAIYASNCQFDGKPPEAAMVICFGSQNKQGFTTRTWRKDQIESAYEAMKHLRKVVDAVGYISKEKAYNK